jgi:hypothetical protein
MQKKNCWEIKKCGREPGGARSKELGVCPTASDISVDGLNNGKNGGRICWAIAGTLCRGEVQGLFAKNEVSCMACEVFKQIKAEEKTNFMIWKYDQTCHSQILLRLLMNNFARHEFQREDLKINPG